MQIVISKEAQRSLLRSNKRKLIASKIEELASDPQTLAANVIDLKGRPGFRLRVQDWRVIFRIENSTLHIDVIEPRGSIYEERK